MIPAPALFAFDHVTVAFGDARALDDVSLELSAGGMTVLAGASGSGKSTLLRLCNRLEVPSSGTVRYRGSDLASLDPLAHRRQVGMVFQRPTLFPGTVRDNLRVARPDGDDTTFAAALERADLPVTYLDRVGDDLSGGEAQRACLARTLLTEPEVLLLDEPTSALDPASTQTLERLGRSLSADGVSLLWVTHDLDQARRVADRTVVLVRGQVADAATTAAYLETGGTLDPEPPPGAA